MPLRLSLAKLIAPLTRKVRFPGREKFLRLIFPPERFRSEIIVVYDNNLKFRCDLRSHIEWQIFFKGYYSPDLSTVIKRMVKSGMQVIDVGANVGAYNLLMAKRVGEDGKVIAFEPNPEVRRSLEYNIKLNYLEERVVISPLALSDREGEFILYTPRPDYPNRGIASLNRHVDVLTNEITVQVRRLDDIFSDLGLERLDFIKVDTEGSDAAVLFGGMEVIKRFLPYIIFEANYSAHPNADVELEKILSQLNSLGYSFFTVGYSGRLKPYSSEIPFPDTDIVCIPEER